MLPLLSAFQRRNKLLVWVAHKSDLRGDGLGQSSGKPAKHLDQKKKKIKKGKLFFPGKKSIGFGGRISEAALLVSK
jgi:hypothetical protein